MAAIGALAGVIVFLFRWSDARVTKSEAAVAALKLEHSEELRARDAREAQIRAECDARLLAESKDYADSLRQDRTDNRAHEDMLRNEFTAVVSTISDQTSKSAEALTEVLGRLHDRFTGPRSRH